MSCGLQAASGVGQDIRAVGSDIRAGQVVLQAGALLGAAEIGILATVGAATVKVRHLNHSSKNENTIRMAALSFLEMDALTLKLMIGQQSESLCAKVTKNQLAHILAARLASNQLCLWLSAILMSKTTLQSHAL